MIFPLLFSHLRLVNFVHTPKILSCHDWPIKHRYPNLLVYLNLWQDQRNDLSSLLYVLILKSVPQGEYSGKVRVGCEQFILSLTLLFIEEILSSIQALLNVVRNLMCFFVMTRGHCIGKGYIIVKSQVCFD